MTKEKIFCISIQRTGTSSVGDFFESLGYKRIGHQVSNQRNWSRHWLNDDIEAIFNDENFVDCQLFEDDPFWFPGFYEILYHRFPEAKFILFDRDSDSWFKSMIRHSNGYSLGQTDIHARIYDRCDDLKWLEDNIDGFNPRKPQGLVLYDKASHYKKIYETFNYGVKSFFQKNDSSRLFHSHLSDPEKWIRMVKWLELEPCKATRKLLSQETHAHKSKGSFTQSDLLKVRGA